jgi:membrane protein
LEPSTNDLIEWSDARDFRGRIGMKGDIGGVAYRLMDAGMHEMSRRWATRVPFWMTAAAVLLLAALVKARDEATDIRGQPLFLGDERPMPTRPVSRPKGWKETIVGLYQEISKHRVLAIAAGVTFYSLLAMFPAVGALVSLYGLFADTATINTHLAQLSMVLPSSAIDVVSEQVTRVAAQRTDTLGWTTIIGLMTALWSANAGVKALFDAFNVVYDQEEQRGFLKLNAVSLGFTMGAILFAMLALSAVVVLPVVMKRIWLAQATAIAIRFGIWPLMLIVVLLALALMYRFGASHERPKWRWITRGSCFASIGFLSASLLFSWYAENFGDFNQTYGSLGAVIGLMMWIWISAIVVLIGAEINAEIGREELGASVRSRGLDTPPNRGLALAARAPRS